MPKIYEYFGIILSFFSNEHSPIHVHAFCEEYQMKVELITKNKEIVEIKYKGVRGYKKFPPNKLNDLKKLIEKEKYEIINYWVKFFVYNERISVKKIKRKIK